MARALRFKLCVFTYGSVYPQGRDARSVRPNVDLANRP